MTRGVGTTRINAVQVGEALIDVFRGPEPLMSAKYAFANAESGARFGQGNWNTWSDETKKKLAELLISMERDICEATFDGGVATDGGGDSVVPLPAGVQTL